VFFKNSKHFKYYASSYSTSSYSVHLGSMAYSETALKKFATATNQSTECVRTLKPRKRVFAHIKLEVKKLHWTSAFTKRVKIDE